MFVTFGVLALVVEHAHILRLVVGQSARYTIAGIALGAILAALAGRWVEPLLFHQSARDPLVFVAVTLMLLAVTLAASAAPAWRAIRAAPSAALRSD